MNIISMIKRLFHPLCILPGHQPNRLVPDRPKLMAARTTGLGRVFRQFVILFFIVVPASGIKADTPRLSFEEQTISAGSERLIAQVPKGYRLELLTNKLDRPRLMAFAENGDLVIGSKSGKVYRLSRPYTDPAVLVELDDYPHSVAFRGGEILIARNHGLYRAPYRPGQKQLAPISITLLAPLPGGSGHSSRTVGVGPDGRVYVSLGIQGNCSDQYLDDRYPFEDRRGGVYVLREAGGKSYLEPFGTGFRNPVGFSWHPQTGVMYASNNGPDHLGYEHPPEYFSRIAPGSFHGMPWYQFNGEKIIRDHCILSQPPRSMSDVVMPVATFPARNAPMAVVFVPQGAMDKSLEFGAIVALRGSWATKPTGGYLGSKATRCPPRIVIVRFHDGKAERVDDLVTGFQNENGDRWARPVGVAVGPDGVLYFTSDEGINGLFRLSRK
jgi:glucose/arabinose dehydrogenase